MPADDARDRLDAAARDAATALRRIAATLGVPVASLYEAADPTTASASAAEIDALVTAFATLENPRTRQRILDTVRNEANRARGEADRHGAVDRRG
ncbi:hypothetical protein Q8W71_12980 [Methylobacterium sp. NEAU 140]|uniref:hypothetical protein n=1 Tax=Methylobacterium sp. NEAU 140 TaxID=3064945 RepID=UPI0027374425|nr:hypothetical protein [Methylobacterium sp. NEAU 140]MDP4023545.1 hypothetical protein [Methylobacterium sp. NEAU 140]